jgi:hypothetical protein
MTIDPKAAQRRTIIPEESISAADLAAEAPAYAATFVDSNTPADLEAAFRRAIAPGPAEHMPEVIVCRDEAEQANVMQRLRPASLNVEVMTRDAMFDAEASVSRLIRQVMDLMSENRALRAEIAALKSAN